MLSEFPETRTPLSREFNFVTDEISFLTVSAENKLSFSSFALRVKIKRKEEQNETFSGHSYLRAQLISSFSKLTRPFSFLRLSFRKHTLENVARIILFFSFN